MGCCRSVRYYNDLFTWRDDWHAWYSKKLKESKGKNPIYGFDAEIYTTQVEFKKRIKELNDEVKEITRGNFVGPVSFNDVLMINGTIAIGASNDIHASVKPEFDRMLWGKEKVWKEEDIKKDIVEFLDKKKSFSVKGDIQTLILQILWKRMLCDTKFSWKDAEKFKNYQLKRMKISILPGCVAPCLGSRETRRYQEEYFYRTIAALNAIAKWRGDWKADVENIAWGCLDSLVFAGGAGTPALLQSCITAMINHKIKIEEKNVDVFIMETARYYPPVRNIPYYRNGQKEMLSMYTIFREKKVWGEDAEDFKLRPLAEYHKNLCAYNEWAPKRACPGKSLAWSIVKTFLLEISRRTKNSKFLLPESVEMVGVSRPKGEFSIKRAKNEEVILVKPKNEEKSKDPELNDEKGGTAVKIETKIQRGQYVPIQEAATDEQNSGGKNDTE